MAQLKYITREASDTISAGKIVNFNIPAYDSICQMFLNFTNNGAPATIENILSSIRMINLKINGDDVITVSPTNLTNVIKALGQNVYHNSNSNVLPLNVVKLMYPNMVDRSVFDLGCDGWAYKNGAMLKISNIQLQVVCNATITDLTDVEVITERINKGTGLNITRAYGKLLTYEENISGTGVSPITSLPKNIEEGYLAVFANPYDGVISKGEVKVNNYYAIQETPIDAMNAVINQRGYGNVKGIFPYIFADGNVQTALSATGVDDFRFNTTFTKAPTTGKYDLVALTIKQPSAIM